MRDEGGAFSVQAHTRAHRAPAVELDHDAGRKAGRPTRSSMSPQAVAFALAPERRSTNGLPNEATLDRSPYLPSPRAGGRQPVPSSAPWIGSVSDPAEHEAERFAQQVAPAVGLVQRACACGGPASSNGECAECRAKRIGLQRTATASGPAVAPAIVHEVLRSPGQPMDPMSRRFFESRLGFDLGSVRIHADAHSATSAESVDALAYTAGSDVVFAAGQYDPMTPSGRHLLAHELAHVAQQRSGGAALRRQPSPTSIDPTAQAIITAAQTTSTPIADRATAAVRAIIDTYYGSQASKVAAIVYSDSEPGLATTYTGTGAAITGTITVGRYFVENTTRAGFARRVLQVGHELQHIDQQRSGMGGPTKRHLREFLAFHWEATAPEAAGTGRVSHASRVALIDAALSNYNCLDAAEKTQHQTKQQALLTLRTTEQAASGQPATSPPTACSG